MKLTRRVFIQAGLAALGAAAVGLAPLRRAAARVKARVRPLLRPPGALPEEAFLRRCIRCGRCAAVCPNTAIRMAGLARGPRLWNTPYLRPRDQACMLCMRCTQVCPTGALTPIPSDDGAVLSRVRMGRAFVDKSMCYSYQNRTCGVCIRACPFPGVVMKTGIYERPIITSACVGCGLCERSCIHIPQAVRIVALEEPARA